MGQAGSAVEPQGGVPYGTPVGTHQCPPGHVYTQIEAKSGQHMDGIQGTCSDGSKSPWFGGQGGYNHTSVGDERGWSAYGGGGSGFLSSISIFDQTGNQILLDESNHGYATKIGECNAGEVLNKMEVAHDPTGLRSIAFWCGPYTQRDAVKRAWLAAAAATEAARIAAEAAKRAEAERIIREAEEKRQKEAAEAAAREAEERARQQEIEEARAEAARIAAEAELEDARRLVLEEEARLAESRAETERLAAEKAALLATETAASAQAASAATVDASMAETAAASASEEAAEAASQAADNAQAAEDAPNAELAGVAAQAAEQAATKSASAATAAANPVNAIQDGVQKTYTARDGQIIETSDGYPQWMIVMFLIFIVIIALTMGYMLFGGTSGGEST